MFLLEKPEIEWKSEWRKEQERRRAEEMGKRKFVTAPQIRERQVRQPVVKRPVRIYLKRTCDVCPEPIRHDNKTGRCVHHKLERPQPLKESYQCGSCDKPIRKTEFGVCKKCFTRYRRRIQQNRPRCLECQTIIRCRTKYGLCRKHARPYHTRDANERRRLIKLELKAAA